MGALSRLISVFVLFAALQTGLAVPMWHRPWRSHKKPCPTSTGILRNFTTTYTYTPSVLSTTTTTNEPPSVTTTTNTLTSSTSTPTNTPTPTTSTTTGPSTSTSPSSTSVLISNSDIQTFLDSHNTVRAQHGAVDLVWNDTLAGKAQQWAARCEMVHSGGQLGDYGENLAAGTGSAYDIKAAVKSWTDEASEYDPNNPVPSHFTQVVWKSTTQLGCALQICNDSKIFDNTIYGPTKFVVCEYSPPGNVIGYFSQNVQV